MRNFLLLLSDVLVCSSKMESHLFISLMCEWPGSVSDVLPSVARQSGGGEEATHLENQTKCLQSSLEIRARSAPVLGALGPVPGSLHLVAQVLVGFFLCVALGLLYQRCPAVHFFLTLSTLPLEHFP